MDAKTLMAIQLFLFNAVLRKVLNEKTTTVLCLKLESLYMTKSFTNELYLTHRLFKICMLEGTSIKPYLDEFNSIITDRCKDRGGR